LLQNGLLLQRGTDGALAGISGLSLAAGRCCRTLNINPSLTFRVVNSRRSKKQDAISGLFLNAGHHIFGKYSKGADNPAVFADKIAAGASWECSTFNPHDAVQ
jgi:hypothetical protein